MRVKANVSFDEFSKKVEPLMEASGCAIKIAIAKQTDKLIPKGTKWKDWLDFKALKIENVSWGSNPSDDMSQLRINGEGSKKRAAALYYKLHSHLGSPEHARAVDDIAFGKPYLERFLEPVFVKDTDIIPIFQTNLYENPPYVLSSELDSNEVDEAVWLNPHNHYSIPLEGRGKEKRRLRTFVEKTTDPFLMWALIGPSGAGKTRLVSEFMKDYVATHSQNEWDAGFVRSRDAEPWLKEDWIKRNTFIVIDYTYNYSDVMKAIAERCRSLREGGHKVRLLVVDHTYPEDLTRDPFWQQFFSDRQDFQLSRSNPAGKRKYLYKDEPLELEPEEEDSKLLRHVIVAAANAGSEYNCSIDDERILKAELHLHKMGEGAANPDAIRHPLFAALLGQAIRHNQKDLGQWTRRDLIENYFARQHRLPWVQDAQGINKNPDFGKWVGAVVAAATLARGAKPNMIETGLPEEYRNVRPQGASEEIIGRAAQLVSARVEDLLKPFEPDILGENFLLHFLNAMKGDTQLFKGFVEMLRFAKGKKQEEDVASGFLEVIDRLVRNLANDDQTVPFVRDSWKTLWRFLQPEKFPESTLLRQCVSIALANAIKQLEKIGLYEHIDNDLVEVNYSDLAEACIGPMWRRAVRTSIRTFEQDSASGNVNTEKEDLLVKAIENARAISKQRETGLMFAAFEDGVQSFEIIKDKFDEDVDVHREDGWTALGIASAFGHIDIVRLLLKHGADTNGGKANDGVTALMLASQNGHEVVARLLLDHGAAVNQGRTDDGFTALMLASQNGHKAIAHLLLDHGATVNQGRTDDGFTALMWASQNGHEVVARLLLDHGAAVNQGRTDDGAMALMAASQNGHKAIAHLLLDHGAAVNQGTTDDGFTALMWASQNGHEVVARLLLDHGAAVNQGRRNDGVTALIAASQNGHEAVTRLLLDHGAAVNQGRTNDGVTALMLASQNGHEAVTRLLLDHGAAVNQGRTDDGVTALMVASEDGHEAVVRLLLDHGAAVNQGRTDDGATALMLASQNGHEAIARLLLGHGAAVNQGRTDDGVTVLMLVSENGHEAIAHLLLDHGAAVNQGRTDDGVTALMAASQNGHEAIARLLLDHGAAVNQGRRNDGVTALIAASQNGHEAVVRLLLDHGAAVNQGRTDDGATAIWIACNSCQIGIVKLLLENEADANTINCDGLSALHVACGLNYTEIIQHLLILPQLDVNLQQMPLGAPPLTLASEMGREAVVKLLLNDERTILNLKNIRDGATALDHAIAAENHGVSIVLRKAGAKRSSEL